MRHECKPPGDLHPHTFVRHRRFWAVMQSCLDMCQAESPGDASALRQACLCNTSRSQRSSIWGMAAKSAMHAGTPRLGILLISTFQPHTQAGPGASIGMKSLKGRTGLCCCAINILHPDTNKMSATSVSGFAWCMCWVWHALAISDFTNFFQIPSATNAKQQAQGQACTSRADEETAEGAAGWDICTLAKRSAQSSVGMVCR